MPVERRGQAILVMINLVNWQQEEPTGCGGGRRLSLDGPSRVTGDCHARFCERLGVKFPGATRRCRVTGIPTATGEDSNVRTLRIKLTAPGPVTSRKVGVSFNCGILTPNGGGQRQACVARLPV